MVVVVITVMAPAAEIALDLHGHEADERQSRADGAGQGRAQTELRSGIANTLSLTCARFAAPD